ncbi:MAG: hypothetical protein LAO03_03515 [Acidobacteriia bacterium]|nr:hypothetical protein [Terriglobia bacterium]
MGSASRYHLLTDSNHEIDFSPPEFLTRPLWRSLAGNIRDRMFPEPLPPLHLTSRPVDVGMLLGDVLALPWYRTVFTNLGNVIAPETLPPLELESRPVDVGELVSDRMSHMWWSSLLRNLADAAAPEQLPALQLSSAPMNASLRSGSMQILRWSSLASWPKVSVADKPLPVPAPSLPRFAALPEASGLQFGMVASSSSELVNPAGDPSHAHGSKLMSKLTRSRMREAFWIGIATAEVAYLLVLWIGWK